MLTSPGAGAGQDQAWPQSGARCLGKGEMGADGSMPDMPVALGAGLMMMMMKSLCHACALYGSWLEEGRSRSHVSSVHHLPGHLVVLHHMAGLVFQELGNAAPGACASNDPSPVLTYSPLVACSYTCPADTFEPHAQEGVACATISRPDGNGASPFCHQKPHS